MDKVSIELFVAIYKLVDFFQQLVDFFVFLFIFSVGNVGKLIKLDSKAVVLLLEFLEIFLSHLFIVRIKFRFFYINIVNRVLCYWSDRVLSGSR